MTNKVPNISKVDVSFSRLMSEIHAGSFKGEFDKAWSQNEIKTLFTIQNTHGYVVELDDMPIGFTIIREMIDEAEIITFCILPKYCRNGYAMVLLEWIIKDLQSNSFKRLFLEVRENNVAAIRLYTKGAFHIVGRRKGYYQNSVHQKIDALVMHHDLIDER
jgi:[ribosomal protein S18]-alanine N-acetyltransferase